MVVAIGQLMSSLNFNVILSVVSAETTVDAYLLREDAEFIRQAQKANSMEELIDWVGENY